MYAFFSPYEISYRWIWLLLACQRMIFKFWAFLKIITIPIGGRSADAMETTCSNAESTAASSCNGLRLELPLAVAQVYNLPVIDLPEKSKEIFRQSSGASSSDRPLPKGWLKQYENSNASESFQEAIEV